MIGPGVTLKPGIERVAAAIEAGPVICMTLAYIVTDCQKDRPQAIQRRPDRLDLRSASVIMRVIKSRGETIMPRER